MQKVRTFPLSSTTTWLWTQVISGIVANTRLDCRLTSGIWSSPTSNNLSTMYFGTASSSRGQSHFRPDSVRPRERFPQDPADPRLVEQGVERPGRVAQSLRQY